MSSNKYNEFDPLYAGNDDSVKSEGLMNESSSRLDDSVGDYSEDFNDEPSSQGNSVRDPNSYGSDDDDSNDASTDYDSKTDGDSKIIDDDDDDDDNSDSYESYDEFGNKIENSDSYDSEGNSSYRDDDDDGDDDDDRDRETGDDYYYDEDYPEEEFYHDEQDEEERRKRTRLRRVWICCIVMLCCLLLLIILLIIFLMTRNKDNIAPTPTGRPTYAPLVIDTDDDFYYDDDIILAPGVITTPMAPFNRDNCEITEQVAFSGEYRNILDQCACGKEIVDMPSDVRDLRDLIIERVAPKFYGENFTIPWTSCEPANMAAVWLASGDNRDAGEPRQRYASALTYYQLNGTVWDYMDGWMTPLNECLWMGLQCNNRDAVNSMALDTNNLFGPVRTIEPN